jgi:hypothetical protein
VGAQISVAEVVLRCKTTRGVVEKRFKHDTGMVDVSRCTCTSLSSLTRTWHICLQLINMGLTELPSKLFCMKNVKTLHLFNNKLCSLPSEIAHLITLDKLNVRGLRGTGPDLTKSHVVSGAHQPAHVSSARTRSADQSQEALCAAIEAE